VNTALYREVSSPYFFHPRSPHPEPVSRLLIERLKLPEQLRVIKEVLEIICAAKLEDVDARALFCYIEEGHDNKLN